MKGTINAAWHTAHRMPQRATLAQRIAWHVEHAQVCGWRPIPARVRQALAKKG